MFEMCFSMKRTHRKKTQQQQIRIYAFTYESGCVHYKCICASLSLSLSLQLIVILFVFVCISCSYAGVSPPLNYEHKHSVVHKPNNRLNCFSRVEKTKAGTKIKRLSKRSVVNLFNTFIYFTRFFLVSRVRY